MTRWLVVLLALAGTARADDVTVTRHVPTELDMLNAQGLVVGDCVWDRSKWTEFSDKAKCPADTGPEIVARSTPIVIPDRSNPTLAAQLRAKARALDAAADVLEGK